MTNFQIKKLEFCEVIEMISASEYYEKCVMNNSNEDVVPSVVDLVDDILELDEVCQRDSSKVPELQKNIEYLSYSVARMIYESTKPGDEIDFVKYFKVFLIPTDLSQLVYVEIMRKTDCFESDEESFNVKHFRKRANKNFDEIWG